MTPGIESKLDCRILLVEDCFDNQRLIAHVLRKAGAEVSVAENGQVAVDLALAAEQAGSVFDIILMDIQMPVMDGHEATRQLRKIGFTNPIIALTANTTPESRQKCLDSGCSDFMTKPFCIATFVTALAEHLAGGGAESKVAITQTDRAGVAKGPG
jgi:CheY-like chemotaxis protein